MQDFSAEIESRNDLGYTPWYTVFLCMLAYIISLIDRQIITLLVDPIRADLQLNDTQFSLLTGLSFALLYAFMGVPIARLTDSKSRKIIISAGIVVWSTATVACGAAKNFFSLFIARMGVGAGQAALSPAVYSMISDSFPKSKMGLALGIYSTGAFFGAGLAYLIGGLAIEWVASLGDLCYPLVGCLKPWQTTFMIVGLPGLLLAIVFYWTVKEPKRMGCCSEDGSDFTLVLQHVFNNKKLFISHYLGFSFLSLSLYAFLFWMPAYLMRVYGLTPETTGLYLGVIVLISNTSGTLGSGWLIDFFTRKGREDSAMLVGIIGAVGVIVSAVSLYFISSLTLTLFFSGIAMFFASFPVATSATAIQIMSPNSIRAQITALFFLIMNLIGLIGGATLVAVCTDYLFQEDKAVGASMVLIASISALIGAIFLLKGLHRYRVLFNKFK